MTDSREDPTGNGDSVCGSGNFWEYKTQDGEYAFHSTDAENLRSIQRQGLRRDVSLGSDTEAIVNVLEENGYADRFPFERANAVYCDVDWRYVARTHMETGALSSGDIIVVVAVDAIDAPTYLADMGVASDIIDYRYGGPGVMLRADSLEEAVSMYQESIERVGSPSEIAARSSGEREHLELVIDGDVPPTAIVDMCQLDSEIG